MTKVVLSERLRGGTLTEVDPAAEGPAGHASQRIKPLYKRLPHGPHQLEQGEVARHQRARIHGAMVEAVARDGYEATSVKQVIGLAGVSRRSFYELFANREECFLATFDVIAAREIAKVRNACAERHAEALQERLEAVFQAATQTLRDDPGAATLLLLDTLTLGPPGAERQRRAMASIEQLLDLLTRDSDGQAALPAPILRGITGGLHGMLAARLRQPSRANKRLTREMLDWTLAFYAPAGRASEQELTQRLRDGVRRIARLSAERRTCQPTRDAGERGRLLCSVLRLADTGDHHGLTALQIAEHADVPINVFLDLFANGEECLQAAIVDAGEQLLAIVEDTELLERDWPQGVRKAMNELLGHLAANPLHAHALTLEAYSSGPEALRRSRELSRELAGRLTRGAPEGPGELTGEAVVGALWHTVRCLQADDRIGLLAALPDHLTYLTLTPFIGAEAAVEALREEPAG
jgi:AcrR family transcriptional regulator